MKEPRGEAATEIRRLLAFSPLWVVLLTSFVLNIWGNDWGISGRWHGDELSRMTAGLVEERRLNPHYFMYGNVAFYRTALAVAPAIAYTKVFDPAPEPSAAAYNAWFERNEARIVTWPRYLSALEAVLLVLVTYLIAAFLFDRRVGLLAAILLALSPVIVYIGHVATADGFSNLTVWLACLAAVLSWRRGDDRWLTAAFLLAGIAIGAKLDRVLVLIPIAVAYAYRERKRRRELALLLLVPLGYVLANPTLLLSPFEFLDGLSRDMFYAAVHDTGTEHSYGTLIWYLRDGTGWPIFALAVGGLAYAAYPLVRGQDRPQLVWLFATFVPYYLIFGSRAVYPWYVSQLLPGLLILAAYATIRMFEALPRPYTVAARGGLAMLLLLALLYPLSVNLQFSNDARYAAGRWIEQNVPAHATLFTTERGPQLPRDRYQIVRMMTDRERWDHVTHPVERLDGHAVYRRVRDLILKSEEWAGRLLGTPVRDRAYQGWYDVVIDDLETRPVAVEQTRETLPEYVVIVQYMQPTVLAWLRSPESGYVQVAEFEYRSLFGRNVQMPMLNPLVWVFQRQSENGG